MPICVAISAVDLPQDYELLARRVVGDGRSFNDVEIEVRAKDGRLVHVSLSISPMVLSPRLTVIQ